MGVHTRGGGSTLGHIAKPVCLINPLPPSHCVMMIIFLTERVCLVYFP